MTDSATPSGQQNLTQQLPSVVDDQVTQPITDPSGANPNDPATANPLDALEQILKDAKAKAGKKPEESAVAAAPPAEPVADEATRLAAIAVKAEAQEVVDSAAIDVQLDALKQVAEMPAYVARVEQDKQKKQQEDEKKQMADENAIMQLSHTKI